MSILAGAGYGAAEALTAEQERKLREFQVKQAAEMQRAALEQRRIEEQNQQAARMRTLDLDDLRRRDDNNARGIDLMRADKQQMDIDAAIESLPPHLKPLGGLFRVGAVGKLGPEDVEDPAARAKREAALHERDVNDRIRVARESRAPAAPRQQQWVFRGDSTQPIPIEQGTAQPGDRPYDPVAARSSKPENDREAVDTAREAKRLASELLQHKGFNGAFGLAGSYMPTLRQSTADAETLRDALTSLLTLENMNKMKGVLSDSDMKLLKQASSTINARMSEGAATAELQRIVEVMGKVAGDAPESQGAPAVDPRVQALIDKYKPK